MSRRFVASGWRTLIDWPSATGLALFGSAVAQLALRAAFERSRVLSAVALRQLSLSVAAQALLALLLGLSVAGLLSTVTRAAALAAYAAPPGTRPTRWAALRIMPALITLSAVEVAISLTLLGGAGLVLLETSPTPLVAALVLAPPLFLVVILVAAARLASLAAARGAAPSTALVVGIELTLRRLPSLLRLAGWQLVHAVPLLGLGALAAVGAAFLHGAAALACQLLLALCTTTVVLWSYASLASFVEEVGDAAATAPISTVVDASRAGAA